ncbi:MAG: O-antigen ligase family protein [Acidobacteria bacterium]|nr:O-antigen ligase family protein [Acidobacteriota bacterium]
MPNSFVKYLPVSLRDKPEKLAFYSLAGCISLGLVSIAVSQMLLAVTVIGYLWMLRRLKGVPPPEMPIVLPLLAFAVWNIIAALASSNILLGLTITKKFFLFLLVLLVPLIVRGEGRLTWIYKAVIAVAVLSSLGGLLQFAADPHRDLLHRITGFMSQWMTYSGLLMLALILLVAFALCNGLRNHKWVLFAAIPIGLALIISQTRNAWMGTVAGIGVLILLRKPRAIAALLATIAVLYFASPASIQQRLLSGLDIQDSTTRTRIECFWTSARMIQDNPWFGVGPKNVKYEALKYRREHEFPDWVYQHMHNNILQVAAETGIIGLILWLWFMLRLAYDALRCYRSANARVRMGEEESTREALTASCAAIGAWVALMIAGMTEYNFGDSEVLTLFLFITCAPYAFMQKRSSVPGSPFPVFSSKAPNSNL